MAIMFLLKFSNVVMYLQNMIQIIMQEILDFIFIVYRLFWPMQMSYK